MGPKQVKDETRYVTKEMPIAGETSIKAFLRNPYTKSDHARISNTRKPKEKKDFAI